MTQHPKLLKWNGSYGDEIGFGCFFILLTYTNYRNISLSVFLVMISVLVAFLLILFLLHMDKIVPLFKSYKQNFQKGFRVIVVSNVLALVLTNFLILRLKNHFTLLTFVPFITVLLNCYLLDYFFNYRKGYLYITLLLLNIPGRQFSVLLLGNSYCNLYFTLLPGFVLLLHGLDQTMQHKDPYPILPQ